MVSFQTILAAALFQAQTVRPVWFRLDPDDRVRALFYLALLIFSGFAFAAFAWWAGRWTRRYMNRSPGVDRTAKPHVDDWSTKPLVSRDDPPSTPKG